MEEVNAKVSIILVTALLLVTVLFISQDMAQLNTPEEENDKISQGVIDVETNSDVENTTSSEKETVDDFRNLTQDIKKPPGVTFEDVAKIQGLNFSGSGSTMYSPGELATNGAYISDYDRDSRPEVLFLNPGESVLFDNKPEGFVKSRTFETDNSGPESALFFDYDNDGYDDLLLVTSNRSTFFENKDGRFVERDIGLNKELSPSSAASISAADYTSNGCLDVLLVQSGHWHESKPEGFYDNNITLSEDNGARNRLFAGDCKTFKETTRDAGLEGELWGYASSFVDLTKNGYPDIHVANEFNNDVVYINKENGTFERHILPEYTDRNAMSSEVADINGDGYLDILVTNIHPKDDEEVSSQYVSGRAGGNNLLLNQGDGTFVDVADEYGVENGGWGWAAEFAEFNNDGHLDLIQANTIYSYGIEKTPLWLGTQGKFVRESANLERTNSHGIVAFDYDQNGKMDVIVSNISGNYHLYENKASEGNWLQVDVESDGNHTTIGTRVYVVADEREQMRVKTSGSDYDSQSPRLLHFGLDEAELVDSVRVEFPDGTSKTIENVDANQRITVSPD